ncbi:MAG: hypothetical protein ACYS17_05600 [Planctomycetota bacterium]|jgi:hypothetical protein
MNRLYWIIGLFAIGISSGCNSDIVTTKHLKALPHKCVNISPFESEDPQIGKVIRDVIEKELIRRKIKLCDTDTATIFITGATFLTVRTTTNKGLIGNQTIESVSLVAKDSNGEVVLSASYDNKDQLSASKLAQEFGSAVADKLR